MSQDAVWALIFTYNQVMVYLFDIDCNFGIMKLDIDSVLKVTTWSPIFRQVGTFKEHGEVLYNHFTTLCCIGCTVV